MAHGEILGWVSRHFCMLVSVDGSTDMSLPKFIVGMLFALAIVISWSYFDGASLGTILLRAVICVAISQAGYFLLVFLMVARSTPTVADRMREAERGLGAPKAAKGEKFSARRSIR
ncbi:exopolysaccharide production repressor exox [Mesorhizobium sp. M4A.F.Ca.ET.022.05.2.1]|uniref:exopolysaccharide production repressor exox n=1 Tax=Mesorhizobium sp. M4A.F.Ca.ET.022.05.2.1 TaxID=2496653 RepID=UPI001FDF6B61|nr:exopolysaccharide production repressor exox [Mesorhizobium sp. M4A.F.Ca.ET.022.05.2.1]